MTGPLFLIHQQRNVVQIWEVLKGVGVDGVGGNVPLFLRFSIFFVLLLGKSRYLQFAKNMGNLENFTATPPAPNPL